MEVYAECPFCKSKAELKLQTVPSSTQQYKCTKCGAWFVKTWYGGRGGGTYSIGTGGITMDVVKVRTCKGSNSIEIQMDWQYEDEKHCSIISMPLEHFRKEDMWSIVRMLLDAAENQSKKKEKSVEWISVKDRLPEDTGYVLAWSPRYQEVVIAWYSEEEDFWRTEDNLAPFPSHWMPLPPAPKEDA